MNTSSPTRSGSTYNLRLILPFFVSILNLCALQAIGQPQLLWPLTIQSVPAGSFGEPRGNHLHSGIDLKTGGVEGVPVRAADEGFVSRIKVSSGGYGKAIYITHPDGLTTVYGHLSDYCGDIADTVLQSQYSRQQFETELFPAAGRFMVRKGQVIGYSGNSGSSSGPHLHFETRNSATEWIHDPAFYGIRYKDTIRPQIRKLFIYTPGPWGWLAGSEFMPLEPSADTVPMVVTVPGPFFLGLDVIDRANNSDSELGVRQVTLLQDDSVVFLCRIDSFSFDKSPMIKAMTDPRNPTALLCLQLPGNRLPIFGSGSGIIRMAKGTRSRLTIRVTDNLGNSSEKTVVISQSGAVEAPIRAQPDIPKGFDLYEPMEIRILEKGKKMHKSVTVEPANAVFRVPAEIRFDKTKKIKTDPSKLVVLRTTGTTPSVLPARISDDRITARISGGGRYELAVDTLPPAALSCRFERYDLLGNLIYEIPFSEKRSGLRKVTAALNGEFVLSGFYTNRDVIQVVIPPERLRASQNLSVSLEDQCGNRTVTEFRIEPPDSGQ